MEGRQMRGMTPVDLWMLGVRLWCRAGGMQLAMMAQAGALLTRPRRARGMPTAAPAPLTEVLAGTAQAVEGLTGAVAEAVVVTLAPPADAVPAPRRGTTRRRPARPPAAAPVPGGQ
jgi:hypothetical protein